MGNRLRDIIEPEIKFDISEKTEVDGEHVLARVKGQFFVPNGKSRNGRYYPKSLWERVINDPNVKTRLKKRTMFGTVGHDADLNDAAIREGIVSHIMTDINIDESGKGIGEALILNTPAGRILNTMLRAGSQLSVSSRANGTFKGKQDGLPVVDENTYDLDGWDFVIDPGFLDAIPKVAESLQELTNGINIENEQEGDDPMSESTETITQKLVENISKENADLKNKVGSLTDEVNGLTEDNKVLKEENENIKEELNKLEEAEKKVAAYEEMGTTEEIREALEKAIEDGKVLKEFFELADTPKDAETALVEGNKFIESINDTFGGLPGVEKNKSVLEQFEELGSVEQVTEALKRYIAVLDEEKAAKHKEIVKEVSEEYSISEEKAESLLEKYSREDIKALYEEIKPEGDDDSTRYSKKNQDDINEDVDLDENKPKKKSLAAKIGENLGS